MADQPKTDHPLTALRLRQMLRIYLELDRGFDCAVIEELLAARALLRDIHRRGLSHVDSCYGPDGCTCGAFELLPRIAAALNEETNR